MGSFRLQSFAMPLIFLGAVLFAIFCGSLLPYSTKSFLYGISVIIKECLIFILPFIIFALVYNAVNGLGTGALKFILLIVCLVCCSNFTNTILSYISTGLCIANGMITEIRGTEQLNENLVPMFKLQIPSLISNDIALLSGMLFGIINGKIKKYYNTEKFSYFLNYIIRYFFKFLIPIMPLFIIGTTLKLQHDNMLSVIYSKYLPILILFIISAYGIVLLEFLIISGFNLSKFSKYINNIFPAIITGFGSMSSAAALPLSIKAAESNLNNPKNASIIVPTTVNIHLVGDCFFIPMMALAVMVSFGLEIPSLSQYLIFSFHFVLAKFAVAAVPGGGVLVMLPVMQNYLGFNTDMLALVMALYILFDPVITACNIAGNGAMAIIFEKVAEKVKRLL